VPTQPGRMVLLGGGARSMAYRQVLATLSGRAVTVMADSEIVSAGAALQAAVATTGSDPTDVAAQWNLGEGDSTDPGPDPASSDEVRHRFTAARG